VLLRLGRLADAQHVIAKEGAEILATASDGEKAVFSALAGRISEVGGSDEAAKDWYNKAYEYSLGDSDVELAAEVQYFFALSAFSKRDVGRLEMHVASVIRSKQPWLRALGYSLRANVAMYEGKPDDALSAFESALLLFASETAAADRYSEAICLKNYTIALYNLDHINFALAALSCYDSYPWTASLATHRYGAAMNLAELFANWGDNIRAYRLLRDAEECAPDLASLLYVHSVRCAQAQKGGELMFANNELTAASRIVRDIDWSSAPVHQRLALLEYAASAASLDLASAQEALQLHRSCVSKESALNFGSSDPRLEAIENYTVAVVSKASGRHEEAAGLLRLALTQCQEINFRFLAGRISKILEQPNYDPSAERKQVAQFQSLALTNTLPAENKRVG
jgi:hypothetical protein